MKSQFLLQMENTEDFISKTTKGEQKGAENTDRYAKAVFKRSRIQIDE